MTAPANANEIRITRVYDAPLALVWDAWTDLAHLSHWWGPRGFTITTTSKDLRAGGAWVFVMHGPDGTDFPNYHRYQEVVPRTRLVYEHGATTADDKPMFHVSVDFRALGASQSEIDIRMRMPSAEAAQQTREIIKKHGGNSTWDRLGEYLEHEVTKKEVFVINRSFDAPIDTMFDMWSKAEHIAQWVPPTGFTMEFKHADVRAGGKSFYSMSNGQFTMYGRTEYLEIRRPELLRYIQGFADENENPSRHPGAPVWPEWMLTTVRLTAEGPQQTRVTVQWEPYGNATAEEVAAFVKERAGMTMGWTGSFDKLEAALVETAGL
jgi:uncharacterized protein YndB with AHSA1/START domain